MIRTTFLLALLASCINPAGDATDAVPLADLEFAHQPVTSYRVLENGVVAIGLGPMARYFVIHPEFSPHAEQLAAAARAAADSGEPMHATIWIRARVPKTAPPATGEPFPFVIVRLATSADPRRPAPPERGR